MVMVQEQTLTYCLNCKRKTMPSRGGFAIWAFLILLLLGVIPGIIYVIYYYMKDLQCPRCGKKNWGESTDDIPDDIVSSTSKTCQNCGIELGLNVKYCYNCGTKCDNSHRCQKCGYVLKPNENYCLQCGAEYNPDD